MLDRYISNNIKIINIYKRYLHICMPEICFFNISETFSSSTFIKFGRYVLIVSFVAFISTTSILGRFTDTYVLSSSLNINL